MQNPRAKAYTALKKARAIIEMGENRALACDGAVGHCREELSNGEFDEMWHHVEEAIEALRVKSKAERQKSIRRVMELASAERKARVKKA